MSNYGILKTLDGHSYLRTLNNPEFNVFKKSFDNKFLQKNPFKHFYEMNFPDIFQMDRIPDLVSTPKSNQNLGKILSETKKKQRKQQKSKIFWLEKPSTENVLSIIPPKHAFFLRSDSVGEILSLANLSSEKTALVLENTKGYLTWAISQRTSSQIVSVLDSEYILNRNHSVTDLKKRSLPSCQSEVAKKIKSGTFGGNLDEGNDIESKQQKDENNIEKDENNIEKDENNIEKDQFNTEKDQNNIEKDENNIEKDENNIEKDENNIKKDENKDKNTMKRDKKKKANNKYFKKFNNQKRENILFLHQGNFEESMHHFQPETFDSLIMTVHVDLKIDLAFPLFFKCLSPNGYFVIYCNVLEQLTKCASILKKNMSAINIRLRSCSKLEYNVEENRTRPKSRSKASSGFILSGIKIT